MKAEIGRLLDVIGEIREKANVNTVFGEPMAVEGRTIVPVAKVAYGFRMGIGHMAMAKPEAEEEMGIDQPQGQEDPDKAVEQGGKGGGGGGGALMARPFAIIEVTPEGTRVEPIVNEQKLALAGSLLIGWSVFCLARTLVKIFGQE